MVFVCFNSIMYCFLNTLLSQNTPLLFITFFKNHCQKGRKNKFTFGNYTFIKYLLCARNCAMDLDTKMNK